MPSTTLRRRRLLAAGGGCLAALAGCVGSSESVHENSGTDGGSFESTHEYEALFVRSDDDDHFVYRTEDEAEQAREDDDSHSIHRRSTLFVLDEEAAAELWIDADEDDEAEMRTFVADTDFDSQSIVVSQKRIEDCYERQIRGVRASDDEFRTRFCRTLKEPMTPCEANRTLMEAIVFRIERPYAERPSSRGSSEGMSCRGLPAARGGGSGPDESDAGNASSESVADRNATGGENGDDSESGDDDENGDDR